MYKYLFLLFTLVGCKTEQKVSYKNSIDTRSKKIYPQVKQTFLINELGLYASNQFDAARLNDLKYKNDSTVVAVINPENTPINKSAYYAFKLWSSTKDTVYVSFQYPQGHRHRYTPKLYKKNEWSTVSPNDMYDIDGLKTLRVVVDSIPTTIAAQHIQSSTDVRQWMRNLVRNKSEYATIRSCGKSIGGRDIPVVDIHKGSPKGKPLIVLLTRLHPPELTGHFAYVYFLESLLEDTPANTDFFERYRVLAFPIVNPDGVDEGHWRHNLGGIDLNRDWSEYRQQEVRNVVNYINRTSRRDKNKIILGIDFHSTYKDVFYTNVERENTALPHFIDDWFAILESSIDNYKVNESASSAEKPVSKAWFLKAHNAVGITYEMGDNTPKDRIETIATTSARAMVKILNKM